ncbi:MAG TPA: hypothetical protein VNM24_08265 [Burkholderiales bacterium]|nr:hypothetical protein [Burkholderiales bacterium]
MAAKLLLSVTEEGATAAVWRSRRLELIRAFDNSQEGLAAFAAYLRGIKGLPVRIVVDTIDEDYRFETLPHASGSDRAQLVARKLRQLYRSTAFAACQLQERVAGKRREDRYLFAAITDPELLLPWLRVIERLHVPVAGIHPLPIITLSLIERFKLKHPNLLLVSKNKAGLRQTFCKNLRFRISRLTAARTGSAPADAYYAEEIGNTRMYLDALTVTHVDDTVTVVIFDHDATLSGIPGVLARERPNMPCVRFGRDEIARKLGISPADLDASPDVLHLHLLASGVPAIDLAPAPVEAGFHLYRMRQYVYIASAAAFLGAVLWAGAAEFRATQIEDQVVDLVRQTRDYQARYAQVTAQFPQAPASAEELEDTVETARRIREEFRTPERMLVVLSRALDGSPDISLRQIEWRYGDPKTFEGLAATSASSAGGATTPRQIAVVSAEVVRVAQDHRAVLDRIRGFAASLGADQQVEEVRVVKLPMDVTSASTLAGTTSETARPPETQFQVVVAFRAGV